MKEAAADLISRYTNAGINGHPIPYEDSWREM